jgi:hypothetical protein
MAEPAAVRPPAQAPLFREEAGRGPAGNDGPDADT